MTTRPPRPVWRATAGALVLMWPAIAHAQAASNARAQDQAVDAFGVRTGVEQIGLYSESQVRGFSLQDAGNYRLEGAYFVRAGNLVDPILARVNTRVGINALGLDFPAPSGVVDYRLRAPSEAPGLALDLTAREYGGVLAEGAATAPLARDLSVLVGGAVNVGRSSAGLSNRAWRAGLVAEWRPTSDIRLLGFGSVNRFDLDGLYSVTATGDRLPPPMPHPRRYTPRWGDHDGHDLNGGLILTGQLARDVDVSASAIVSALDLPQSDFVNLLIGPDGRGSATVVSNRPRSAVSRAAALTLGWRYRPGQRLYGEARLRRTRNLFRSAVAIRVPDVRLAAGLPDVAAPELDASDPARDVAEQASLAIGQEASFGRFRLKTGVQKAWYRRRFTPLDGPADALRSTPWLYDASLLADLGGGVSGWAAVTRGIEEAGVAPSNAVNRNEVLPAILVNQAELGLRYRTAGGLAVIGSAYSISKPAAVLDRDGVFGLSGSLRHRGLELSLAGPVAPGLRLLAGASLLDAQRGGELVRAGLISAEPPGTSRVQGLLGVTGAIAAVPGLSLDGQLSHWSGRRVRSDRALRTPAVTTVDVGALYAFSVGATDLTLRLRVTNLLNSNAWLAQRSELLDRVSRRGVRLTLSLRRK